MSNEADTCREYVVPRLKAAGWEVPPRQIREQHYFTDGRTQVHGNTGKRGKRKFADYLLHYTNDLPIAIVEAKRDHKLPGDGLQQAKDYAEILGIKFAYATNGHGIVEFDYTTGLERELADFPTPDELWSRLAAQASITPDVAQRLLTPFTGPMRPRYYQQIAIDRAVQATQAESNPVLLVADLLHPVGGLAVELFGNRDVRHGRGWRGAVPMLLSRREPDHARGAIRILARALARRRPPGAAA